MQTDKKTYYKTKENKKVNNFIKKKTQNSVKSKYKEEIKKDTITKS